MNNFFDLCVKPSSRKMLEEMTGFAEKLEIDFLGVCRDEQDIDNHGKFISEVEEVGKNSETDLLKGVIIKPENSRDLNNKVSTTRENFEIVTVQGGDDKINRAVSEDSRIDLLVEPYRGRRDPGIDHVISRKLAENRVCVGINFRRVLKSHGKRRSQLISKIDRIIFFSEKFGFDIVLVSGAEEVFDMRSPRDMASIGQMLGKELQESRKWVSENPGSLIKRVERRRGNGFVMPGVEVVEDES